MKGEKREKIGKIEKGRERNNWCVLHAKERKKERKKEKWG